MLTVPCWCVMSLLLYCNSYQLYQLKNIITPAHTCFNANTNSKAITEIKATTLKKNGKQWLY